MRTRLSREVQRLSALSVALIACLGTGCNGQEPTRPSPPAAPTPPPTTPSTPAPTPPPEAPTPFPVACEASRRTTPRSPRSLETLRSSIPAGRIVGGSEAAQHAWPATAAIVVRQADGTLFQYCGGSLISPSWVLTAAHCEVRSSDRVLLGRHDLDDSAGEEHTISFVLTHNAYGNTPNNNDIALIKLATPSSQTPIALVDAVDTNAQPGDDATIVGWGALSEGGATSDTLQQVSVPIVSNAQCAEVYSTLTENMLCAGTEAGGLDSCQGDSGGPLMVRASSASPSRQSGVVSFGIGCARPNIFGVYTRVSRYLDWIAACQNNPPD